LLALTLALGTSNVRAAALSGERPGGEAAEWLSTIRRARYSGLMGSLFSFRTRQNLACTGLIRVATSANQHDGSLNTINEKLITGLTGPLAWLSFRWRRRNFPRAQFSLSRHGHL